jgi:hypothetical protein
MSRHLVTATGVIAVSVAARTGYNNAMITVVLHEVYIRVAPMPVLPAPSSDFSWVEAFYFRPRLPSAERAAGDVARRVAQLRQFAEQLRAARASQPRTRSVFPERAATRPRGATASSGCRRAECGSFNPGAHAGRDVVVDAVEVTAPVFQPPAAGATCWTSCSSKGRLRENPNDGRPPDHAGGN